MVATLGWVGIIRLGLVQTALGAVVVLTTSTLNRVMVVELALPALLPGLLVALHYAVQVTRPRMGHGSDAGGRRTPWILGGMAALRAKSLSLTHTFIEASRRAAHLHGLELLTPLEERRRGSQVSWGCGPGAPDGYTVMSALIRRGVIGDFRAGPRPGEPDILRFGFAPLYNTHEEAWQAAQALGEELEKARAAGASRGSRAAVT